MAGIAVVPAGRRRCGYTNPVWSLRVRKRAEIPLLQFCQNCNWSTRIRESQSPIGSNPFYRTPNS